MFLSSPLGALGMCNITFPAAQGNKFTSSNSCLCSKLFQRLGHKNIPSCLPSVGLYCAVATGFCPSWLSSKELPYPTPNGTRNPPQNCSLLLLPISPWAQPWAAWLPDSSNMVTAGFLLWTLKAQIPGVQKAGHSSLPQDTSLYSFCRAGC